jgi:hypothetical protein
LPMDQTMLDDQSPHKLKFNFPSGSQNSYT